MRDLIILLVHMATTVVRIVQPGGVRAVIAESILTKHQLLILNRSRRRGPNLRTLDRLIAGLWPCDSLKRSCQESRMASKWTGTFAARGRRILKSRYSRRFGGATRRRSVC